jgi:hypothetical protein
MFIFRLLRRLKVSNNFHYSLSRAGEIYDIMTNNATLTNCNFAYSWKYYEDWVVVLLIKKILVGLSLHFFEV